LLKSNVQHVQHPIGWLHGVILPFIYWELSQSILVIAFSTNRCISWGKLSTAHKNPPCSYPRPDLIREITVFQKHHEKHPGLMVKPPRWLDISHFDQKSLEKQSCQITN
jgi:hypothetical protein